MLPADALPISAPLLPKQRTRIARAPYFADILHDPNITPHIWHWLVQHTGQCEILYWGQERSEAEALRSANDTLDYLLKQSHPKHPFVKVATRPR